MTSTKMHLVLVLSLLAATASACGGGGRARRAGGGPESTIVRPRATYELVCPDEQLEVTRVTNSTYAVAGCGARATYTCMGGMGQYACRREGDVEGASSPTVPAGARDVTASDRPVSSEVLPRARARLGCEDVLVYEIARLTYAAHGCGQSVVFACMGGMGQYSCEME